MRATTRPNTRHPAAAPLALPRTTPPRLPRALALLLLLALTLLTPLAHAQTTYAWTGAISNQWSVAGNWNPIGVPANGDSLVFPAGAANLTNNNDLPVGRSLAQVTFTGSNYTLSGNDITLSNSISSQFGLNNNIINLPMNFASHAVSINGTGMAISAPISGDGSITLNQLGGSCSQMQAFSGTHTFNGTLTTMGCVQAQLNGASFAAATVVHGSQGLFGNGTLGALTWNANTWLAVGGNNVSNPFSDTSTGILNTGALAFGGIGQVFMNINGASLGAGYDQINVTGSVTLGTQKTLNLTLGSSFVPALGQQFVLINNDGADAVSGTFSGLPQGSTITLGGAEFQLSYSGGTGNDVVLTCTFSPKAWNGSVSGLWSNPNNWTPVGVPAPGDGLLFPSGAIRLNSTNDLLAGTTFSRITFTGSNYTLSGNDITLSNSIIDPAK